MRDLRASSVSEAGSRRSGDRPQHPLRSACTFAVLTALLLGLVGSGLARAATASHLARAHAGVGFIASKQNANGSIVAFSPVGSTADAVVSMVAAGVGRRNIDDAMGYLARQARVGNVTGVGLLAKVAMAAAASGRDPRAFGGVNLVRQIASTEGSDGRYGAGTAVFDQALGILGLRAAGRTPSLHALDWLHDAQCADGGWQYDEPPVAADDAHCHNASDPNDYFSTDSNTTSLAVQALEAGPGSPTFAHDPFAFLASLRDPQYGGWGYTIGFSGTDANSTALAIQAYVSADRSVPSGGLAALDALQYTRCGAWAYSWDAPGNRGAPNLGATIGAVLGELRRALPIGHRSVTEPAPVTPPCP